MSNNSGPESITTREYYAMGSVTGPSVEEAMHTHTYTELDWERAVVFVQKENILQRRQERHETMPGNGVAFSENQSGNPVKFLPLSCPKRGR